MQTRAVLTFVRSDRVERMLAVAEGCKPQLTAAYDSLRADLENLSCSAVVDG